MAKKLTNLMDYIGIQFGRLTVISFEGTKKIGKDHPRASFNCKCSCGKEKIISISQLKQGITQSCGCFQKECMAKQGRLNGIGTTKPNYESNKNEIFTAYKKSASKRNLEFLLTKEEFYNFLDKNCYYCGDMPISRNRGTKTSLKTFIYNGVDRKDNKVGYSLENCVTCCSFCNVAKHHHSLDLFLDKIKKISLKHGNT